MSSDQNGHNDMTGPQGDGLPFSPHGLHVLAVDDDKLCLKVIAKMLQQCHYEVQTCSDAHEALARLRDTNNHFDLVLSDVVMPDVDGFKLLEIIGLEMDIPVIMMSYDGDTHTVLKGVTHGAVDFLIKPVRLEELSNMWQHVVRKRRTLPSSEERAQPDTGTTGALKRTCSHSSGDAEPNQAADPALGVSPESKKRGNEDKNTPQSTKRPRVHWSSHMHSQFVAAVNKLGIDKAVPKKILELMGVDGLTRENVASHLQKYRLYLKKAAKIDGGAAATASQPQAQAAQENKPTPPAPARQPSSAPPQSEAQYASYTVPQEGVMMPNVQQAAQPQMQAVYAGVPAGTYMPQPPWQAAPMMCAPVPQHGAYMQHMPQAHWGQQPMMPQQVAACMPMEHPQVGAGYPHGVPVGMSPQAAAVTGGYSGSAAQAPMNMGVGAPSTLPPLSAEQGMDDDMENEFPGKPGDLNDVMPLGGLGGGPLGDGVDDAGIPEEMDDFLNILANGGQNNSI